MSTVNIYMTHILQATEIKQDNSVICNSTRLHTLSKQDSDNTMVLIDLKISTAIILQGKRNANKAKELLTSTTDCFCL